MPDPNWTYSYNMNSNLQQNGFVWAQSPVITGSPVVTEFTTGPQANRRLEIDSSAGSVVYINQNEPNTFDPDVGLTGEIEISTQGGNAGFEFTFLDQALLLEIRADEIDLYGPGGDPITVPIDMTTRTKLRVTVDSSRAARVYANDVPTPIAGPLQLVLTRPKPNRRFLFWQEQFNGNGALAVIHEMRFFDGGPVLPG